MAKFSKVLTIVNGKNQSKVENPHGKYPIYGSGGVMGYADDYLCEAETVVIGRKGSINKPIYVEESFWNVDTAFGLVANRKILLPKYLFYFCVHFDFEQLNTTVTIPSLTKANLLNVEMKLPSLAVQQEIVDRLSKVDELISLRKEQLAKLDQLVKSRFIELFGDPVTNEKNWVRLTLGDICEIGSSKRVFEKDYVPSGIPFFRTKEIVELSKGNPISTELFITEEHFAELKKSYGAPKKDDLLISAVGTIGTIWIVSGEYEFYFKDGNLIQIKASSNFNSIFMKYLLDELIANYKKEMSTGTAYSALTIAGLKKMLVYDVPLALQEQFAAFVKQTDKSKLAIQQSLDKLELLKKSLMQEYFG